MSGIPVVCSNRAGASGLIREGESGAIIDAANADAFTASLRDWIGRARPLDPSPQDVLWPSLMAVNFADAVDGFLALVAAAQAARSRNSILRRPEVHQHPGAHFSGVYVTGELTLSLPRLAIEGPGGVVRHGPPGAVPDVGVNGAVARPGEGRGAGRLQVIGVVGEMVIERRECS